MDKPRGSYRIVIILTSVHRYIAYGVRWDGSEGVKGYRMLFKNAVCGFMVRKRGEEESTGRMEWVEKNVRSDLR